MFQQRPGFADDEMQMNVHKTLHACHRTNNFSDGTATVTKQGRFLGLLRFQIFAEGSQQTGKNAMCIKFCDYWRSKFGANTSSVSSQIGDYRA